MQYNFHIQINICCSNEFLKHKHFSCSIFNKSILLSIDEKRLDILFCSDKEGILILIFFISFLLISRNVEPEDLLKNSFFNVEIK